MTPANERLIADTARKTEILTSLRRLEFQLREVATLVDMDQCDSDVLAQLSAIIASSRRVGLLVLQERIRRSLDDATFHQQDAVISDVNETIARFTRAAF